MLVGSGTGDPTPPAVPPPPVSSPPPSNEPSSPEYFADFARRSVEDTIELARPEFEAYVESLAPGDPDDEALVRRFTERVSSLDAAVQAIRTMAS